MSKIIRLAILMVLLSGLVGLNMDLTVAYGQSEQFSVPDGSSENYSLDWVIVGEVSGGTGSSDQYKLSATIGQKGVGTHSESEHYVLCAGFQCASLRSEYRLFLPMAER